MAALLALLMALGGCAAHHHHHHRGHAYGYGQGYHYHHYQNYNYDGHYKAKPYHRYRRHD